MTLITVFLEIVLARKAQYFSQGKDVSSWTIKQRAASYILTLNKTNASSPQEVKTSTSASKQQNANSSHPVSAKKLVNRLKRAAYALQMREVTPSSKTKHLHFNINDKPLESFVLPVHLIRPWDMCGGPGGPLVVVLVLSSYRPEAGGERQAVRDTYGSVTRKAASPWPGNKPLAGAVRLVFILGKPQTAMDSHMLIQESHRYNDLVVGDFNDSYDNLPMKDLFGFHWAITTCPQARYLMKSDDDVFLHLPLLTSFLRHRGRKNSIYGFYYSGPSLPCREGKWKVTQRQYPFDIYPEYASGTSYVLSMDAVAKILDRAPKVPVIPIEDVYITGVLALVGGVQKISSNAFTYFGDSRVSPCLFVQDKRIAGHNTHAKQKYLVWETLKKAHGSTC